MEIQSQWSSDFSFFNRLNGEFYMAWNDQRNKQYIDWYDTLVRIYIEVISLVDEVNDDNLKLELRNAYNTATTEINNFNMKSKNNNNFSCGALFQALVNFDIVVRKPLRKLGIDVKLRNPLEGAYRT